MNHYVNLTARKNPTLFYNLCLSIKMLLCYLSAKHLLFCNMISFTHAHRHWRHQRTVAYLYGYIFSPRLSPHMAVQKYTSLTYFWCQTYQLQHFHHMCPPPWREMWGRVRRAWGWSGGATWINSCTSILWHCACSPSQSCSPYINLQSYL